MTLTIPGLDSAKVHQRSDWEDPQFRVAAWVYNGKVYVAPKIDLKAVDGNADHYPGSTAATIRTDTNAKTIAHLQAVQSWYVKSRGYSIGYGIAIDERGHAWDLRGFDFKCAANSRHNGHIVAIYFILGATQKPSQAMIDTARLAHRESARRAGRATTTWTPTSGWWVSGHNALREYPPLFGKGTITSCCGAEMYRLLNTKPVGDGGELNPNLAPGSNPPPPPPASYDPPINWGLFPVDDNKPWVGVGTYGELNNGPHVRYVQDVIYFKAGGNIVRDGKFGPQTASRVVDVQRLFGQKKTGSVSNGGKYADDTWSIVDGLAVGFPEPPPPPPPPPPPQGDHVLLYRVKQGQGYWNIVEDVSVDGKATTDRVKAVQAANDNKPLKPDDLINIPGRISW